MIAVVAWKALKKPTHNLRSLPALHNILVLMYAADSWLYVGYTAPWATVRSIIYHSSSTDIGRFMELIGILWYSLLSARLFLIYRCCLLFSFRAPVLFSSKLANILWCTHLSRQHHVICWTLKTFPVHIFFKSMMPYQISLAINCKLYQETYLWIFDSVTYDCEQI